jgi:hypothetical protein
MATAESAREAGAPGSADLRLLLVNSTIAFALAQPIMVVLHEFAHAVAALQFGLQPRVYPGQVIDAVPGTTDQQVVTLLAGPAGSLLIGLAVLLVAPVARGFRGLFILWLGALSVQECTGYLMTGPFLAIGDIGSALHLLAAPSWAYWLLFLVGVAGTALLGRHFTRRLLTLTAPGAGDVAAQLRYLGLFAWLIGAAATLAYAFVSTALASGAHDILTPVGLVEALATLTSGIFVFWVRFFMMGGRVPGRAIAVGWTWPLAGVALWLVISVARTVVLEPGLQL